MEGLQAKTVFIVGLIMAFIGVTSVLWTLQNQILVAQGGSTLNPRDASSIIYKLSPGTTIGNASFYVMKDIANTRCVQLYFLKESEDSSFFILVCPKQISRAEEEILQVYTARDSDIEGRIYSYTHGNGFVRDITITDIPEIIWMRDLIKVIED